MKIHVFIYLRISVRMYVQIYGVHLWQSNKTRELKLIKID